MAALSAQRPHGPSRSESSSLRLALATYSLIFAIKVFAYVSTGVVVLLAESLHSLTDILVSAFLFFAAYWSGKKADEDHMFGHGRAQYAAGLVAATLFLSFTSLTLYEHAIPKLLHPQTLSQAHLPLAIAIIGVSMGLSLVPLFSLVRNSSGGAAAKALLFDLYNDEAGLAAALIGTLLAWAGYPVADPIAAIIVATVIAINAARLFRENLVFILGRAPDRKFLGQVEEIAWSVPGVVGVHDVRAEIIGPDMFRVQLHVAVRRDTLIQDADAIAERVSEELRRQGKCRFCLVHVDALGGEKREFSED
jgi:cation diffusion facilitator family transporter